MNTTILNEEVQAFIAANLNADSQQLALKGSPFESLSIHELINQIQAKKKAKEKLPTWFNTEKIYYPAKLSIEQTSSEITAKYKAEIIPKGNVFIDLTAGFGVDTYYFAKRFQQAVHCEINTELAQIVAYNYNKLCIDNVTCIAQDGLTYLKETDTIFDCIYIDPSRRNSTKGKVFLLEDYEPNVLEHLDFILDKTNTILIKVSPLLDISNVLKTLQNVAEVHCVAVQNEMKELLFYIQKNFAGEQTIKTINFNKSGVQTFDFTWRNIVETQFSMPQKYLYEPNSAIMKSGGFNALSTVYRMQKLHANSQLFTHHECVDFPGRVFEIQAIIKPSKKAIRQLIPSGKANVTVRNFPNSVAALRKKFKLKDGGSDYLFFTTLQDNSKVMLHCRKV